MATLGKARNQAGNGIIFRIEVLDSETEGMSPSQIGNLALMTLREAIVKRAAKDTADARIAQAQADKEAATDL
jgi:hypothetical protein